MVTPGQQGTRRAITASGMAIMLLFACAARAEPSGEPTNEPRSGKVSEEEIALLLEQQKLLVPSFLAMQQKLKQLQNELDALKAQLAQANTQPHRPPQAAQPQAAAAPGQQLQQAIHTPTVTVQQDSPYLQKEWIAVLAGMLFILVLWLGSRHYTRAKLRGGDNWQQGTGATLKTADNPPAAAKQPVQPAEKTGNGHAPRAARPPNPGAAGKAACPAALPAKKTGGNGADDDSMLEEAGLYAANGRMDKAAGILLEIIKRNPAKVEAWTLLFSVYSALCKVADFEKAARAFLKHHKASPSWSGIQVLGRTLDRDNPLYADQNSQISAAPLLPDSLSLRRPLGDILIEMGILSQREILKYLDEFDPKQHGRFGGYLVARKAISIAQLDQALLQQQGISTEAKPGGLPSLQDIEKFLVDFNPKQHGNVTQFLASRNIVTPEQLGQLLRQTPNQGTAANKPQASDLPLFGALSTS